MNQKYFLKTACLILVIFTQLSNAQIDSTLFKKKTSQDTVKTTAMNMDAIYNRPMLKTGFTPVTVGGYMEANWQHIGSEGESEGHQFQFRRLSIFIASSISKRIKFMSEVEFEPSEKEIEVEFAALDFEFSPMLNLRGGMIVNPIGAFNQNHDGPKWEFTDRPIAAEQMLPDTWSNAGFGIYGKYYHKKWMIGYEAYLSGGFDDSIIDNEQNKTYLPAAKENAERFEEIASGQPLFTGKIAVKNQNIGEIGLSYMGHIFNTYYDDGNTLDIKRRVDVYAVDFNTTLPTKTSVTGEWAWIFVDVPETYTQQYGNKQHGGYIDFVHPLLQRKMFGWENAVINLGCRLEYVDWNVGKFRETHTNIGDDTWSIVGAVSFRPTPQTVIRLNYRHQRTHDLLGNSLGTPPARTGGFSLGISTYF